MSAIDEKRAADYLARPRVKPRTTVLAVTLLIALGALLALLCEWASS